MATLANRSIAEAVGTGLLVYFGAGAAAITLMIANGTKPATPFNIGIGQLGGLGDWFAIGLTFGIVIAVVIYALGRVSGAHINPAVTIALWATKRFPAGDAVAYIVAQLIGAAAGSLLFFLTVGMDAVTIGGLRRPAARARRGGERPHDSPAGRRCPERRARRARRGASTDCG